MDSSEVIHKRILDVKWKSLEKRGFNKPNSETEKQERLMAAEAGRKRGLVESTADGLKHWSGRPVNL
jgi:hypothetical protein